MSFVKEVLFSVGIGTYGIDVSEVMGIEKQLNIVGVPNAPKNIKGIINLRGDILPVYSLRNKFNLSELSNEESKEYIIGKSHGMSMALEVDAVREIVEIDQKDISGMPAVVKSAETNYVKTIAHLGKELILVLDLDGLLDDEQKNQLTQFMDSVND